MAEELKAQFEQAASEVTKLSQKPESGDLLRLYALYKQAMQGDCTGSRPGMLDFTGRAKYDGWKALAGTSKDDAMTMYIEVVNELKAADQKK